MKTLCFGLQTILKTYKYSNHKHKIQKPDTHTKNKAYLGINYTRPQTHMKQNKKSIQILEWNQNKFLGLLNRNMKYQNDFGPPKVNT